MFDPEADIYISKASAPQLMKPFATDGGVYIIELKEKTKKDEAKASDANDTQIKWQIYNKFYGQLGDSLHNKYSKEFAEYYNSEISDEGIARFIAEIQNWSDEMPTNDSSFPEDKRDIYLAKIGDQKITSGSFIDEFQGQFYRNFRRVDTEQKLKKVLTDYVEKYIAWIKKAEEAGIDEEPEIKQAITEFRESQLLDKFNRSQIQDLATVTKEEMDSYYEKNKEMYTIPEKLKIWEIVVRDEDLAKEIYQKATQPGSDFEALAREYSISESTKKRGGTVGYLTRDASRPFVEQAYAAGADQIIGPIKDNDLFYIIKTGDLLPSKVRSRQELEPSLRTAASREKADSIQTKILEDLKAENKFWINENLLKNMN
jgi:parvulin-like peptidyl-prolyl isomerase